jgi:hypothetical protein
MTMRLICECVDCGCKVGFRGFGHSFCWKHYSDWILSYKVSGALEESQRHAQYILQFPESRAYNAK